MGRLGLIRFIVSPKATGRYKMSQVNNMFGYTGARMSKFSLVSKTKLLQSNRHATGLGVEDDYEVDYSEQCFDVVKNFMRSECANAGQQSLVEDCLDNAEYSLTIPVDYKIHLDEPDYEFGENYLFLDTPHPEAIGLIIEKAYEVWHYKAAQLTRIID